MASTTITLVTGESLVVAGSLDEVGKELEDATRSGAGRFAWLTDDASGERIAIRPAHVVLIQTAESREA